MKKLSAQMSNTTATLVVHEHVENMFSLAYVADGMCLFRSWIDTSNAALDRKACTRDHTTSLSRVSN